MKKNTKAQFSDVPANTSCCPEETVTGKDFKSHWDNAYNKVEVNRLGWYEETPEPSLELIQECKLDKSAFILNVGAGTTTLVDKLQEMGYQNIIASDISSLALDKLKDRLGANHDKVRWIVDDLTQPTKLGSLGQIDLWHDRAVLHFFNQQEEQNTYFNLLKKLVRKGGYAVIATFNLDGADKCSGLPVYRYNEQMLAEKIGNDFNLIKFFNYTYTMPSGDTREYVYTLFKRA